MSKFALLLVATALLVACKTPPTDRATSDSLTATASAPAPLAVAAAPTVDSVLLQFDKILDPLQTSLGEQAHKLAKLDERAKDSAVLALDSNWDGLSWEPLQTLFASKTFLHRLRHPASQAEDTLFLNQIRDKLERTGLVLLSGDEMFVPTSALGARLDLLEPALTPAMREYLTMRLQEQRHQTYYDASYLVPMDTVAQRALGWEAFGLRHPQTLMAAKAEAFRMEYVQSLLAGTPNDPAFSTHQASAEFTQAWKRAAATPPGPTQKLVQEWYGLISGTHFRWNDSTAAWFDAHELPRHGAADAEATSGE